MCHACHPAGCLADPEFALTPRTGFGSSRIPMEGLQGAVHLLVCLAWEMLALAKSVPFPDIPRLSWPQECGWWSQAPALIVTCGGWQEDSDNEVGEPLWPLGSFLPITQRLVSLGSGLYLTTNTVLSGEQPSLVLGLCSEPGPARNLISHFPTSHTCLSN